MPRAVLWGRTLAPAALAAAASRMISRYCSGRWGNWKNANVSGRPLWRDTSAIQRDLGAGLVPVLGAVGLEAGHDLVDAPAAGAQRLGQGEQLVGQRERARHGPAVRRAVAQHPGAGEPQRPRRDRLVDRADHQRQLVGVGMGVPVDGALAHGVEAHRAVPDHAAHVDALGKGVERGVVLAVALPVPVEAGHDRGGRDVLHRLHQLGQQLVIGRLDRGEGDAAVADHDRGHTVPARRAAGGVPGDLGVEVAVDVDEAGGDDPPGGVDRAGGGAARARRPPLHPVADDAHVGPPGRRPGAVDDRAAGDGDVVGGHWLLPSVEAAILAGAGPARPAHVDHRSVGTAGPVLVGSLRVGRRGDVGLDWRVLRARIPVRPPHRRCGVVLRDLIRCGVCERLRLGLTVPGRPVEQLPRRRSVGVVFSFSGHAYRVPVPTSAEPSGARVRADRGP